MIKIYRGYPTMHTREWIIEHPDLSKVPFYLEALENMDIKIVKVGSPNDISLVYSFDNENWEDFDYITTDYTITGISVLEGQKLYLKSKSENGSFSTTLSHYYYIKASKKFNVAGNIMSLIYNNFIDKTEINSYGCFNNLFHGSTMNRLIDASNLILPATTLSESCYSQMFTSCQYLEKAPKILPAITLTSSCYSMMFYNCYALTYSPELPATTVANSCYFNMFGNCYKLMNIRELVTS